MPSPAIVIAIVALVAAMSGAALAGPSAKKVTTKKVKKIADKEIAKAAPGLSVAHAGSADNATNAANAASAAQAQNAGTANGVKPIKVNFTGPSTQAVTPVDQGGVKVVTGCSISSKSFAALESTANNGNADLVETNVVGANAAFPVADFDTGQQLVFNTGSGGNFTTLQVTINYQGADGTTVTGQLVLADPSVTPSGDCRVGGTLFLGS